jgi:hypothetical protein
VEKNPVKMEKNPVCVEKNPVKMEKNIVWIPIIITFSYFASSNLIFCLQHYSCAEVEPSHPCFLVGTCVDRRFISVAERQTQSLKDCRTREICAIFPSSEYAEENSRSSASEGCGSQASRADSKQGSAAASSESHQSRSSKAWA